MQIKYKIIAVYPESRTIVARYYTDTISEEDLVLYRDIDGKIVSCKTDVSISIPTPTPSSAELETLISRYFPTSFFETLNNEVTIDPMESVVALIGVETSPVAKEKTDAEIRTEEELAFRVNIQQILDNEAKAKGYYNIDTAASYAGRDGAFQAEGNSFFDWRTSAWVYHNKAIAAYRAGTDELPDYDTILLNMPGRVLPT